MHAYLRILLDSGTMPGLPRLCVLACASAALFPSNVVVAVSFRDNAALSSSRTPVDTLPTSRLPFSCLSSYLSSYPSYSCSPTSSLLLPSVTALLPLTRCNARVVGHSIGHGIGYGFGYGVVYLPRAQQRCPECAAACTLSEGTQLEYVVVPGSCGVTADGVHGSARSMWCR